MNRRVNNTGKHKRRLLSWRFDDAFISWLRWAVVAGDAYSEMNIA